MNMAPSTPTDREFERLANEFLAKHPDVPHEWRQGNSLLTRWTSLICGRGQANEVFASLNRGGQIAVGVTNNEDHQDFEDWGRPVTEEQVAREAFDHFVELLRAHGHLRAAV